MRKKRVVLSPGDVVRELREKKGWTQKTLARLTDIAVPNLSNIERGVSRLGEDRAIILAAAFGVRPEFLLFPNGFERKDLQERVRRVHERLREFAS